MKHIYCWYIWNEVDDVLCTVKERRTPAEFVGFVDNGAEIICLDDGPSDCISKGSHVIVHRENILFMSKEQEYVYFGTKPIAKETNEPALTMTIHMDDQTIKADAGKPKLTLVPQQIIFDIAKVREYGVAKYGASESWKDVDIQRYRDALFRHFIAYLKEPQGVDEESGLPHIAHMACNMAFLCEMEKQSSIKED